MIEEGGADIVLPEKVFYNPTQEFNRDLSIAVLRAYHEELLDENDEMSVLDAMAGSGVRACRIALQLNRRVGHLLANDLSHNAIDAVRANALRNGLRGVIDVQQGDANLTMLNRSGEFDVIDLDPFGSVAFYLGAAVQSIKKGGLLCVTSTDSRILCGLSPEISLARYGVALHRMSNNFTHELAIRCLLKCVESHANLFGRCIEPLVSLHSDFYYRLFLRVHESKAGASRSCLKQSLCFYCTACASFWMKPVASRCFSEKGSHRYDLTEQQASEPPYNKCPVCLAERLRQLGPIWSSPIHDSDFISKIDASLDCLDLRHSERIRGKLALCSEEVTHAPLFFDRNELKLTNGLKSDHLRSALLNLGYEVSGSHTCGGAIKTNASSETIYALIAEHARNFEPLSKHMAGGDCDRVECVSCRILRNPRFSNSIDKNVFRYNRRIVPKSKLLKLQRYPPNPTANWGPKKSTRCLSTAVSYRLIRCIVK